MKFASDDSRALTGGNNGQGRLPKRGRSWLLPSLLFVAIVIYALFGLPTPYVILQPGSAESIKPMVHIDKGFADEKGSLMLTTVRMTYTNMAGYVTALMNPYAEIFKKKDIFQEGESQAEYSERQEYIMLTSQSSAIQAAYKKANIPYHIRNEGVLVLKTVQGLPAEKVFEPGDVISQVDGDKVESRDQLLDIVQRMKAGDSVAVTFKRKGVERKETIKLSELPGDNAPTGQQAGQKASGKVGLGIYPADLQSIQADQPDRQVEIKAGEIGGPSAGLMFSLEIYNQLTEGDLTKGYKIAGTGTIQPDGTVGVIGGIQHKIVAADREGAEIFFAPKDLYPDKSKGQSFAPIKNTTDAIARAKKIKTNMKIVSVGSMSDAIEYLSALPPKQQPAGKK